MLAVTFHTIKVYKTLFFGLVIILVLTLLTLFPEKMSPYDPIAQDSSVLLQGPSTSHLLGTDYLGRDVISRLIYGTRISVVVGFFSMLFALLSGVFLGLIAGFYGSWIDNVIMRFTDTMLAFPRLVLALTITTVLGQSLVNVIIALSITSMPIFSRLIRGETLTIMNRDYIRAARACSAGDLRIMLIHILPNVMNLVLIQASLTVAYAILAEASMSFLGLGVPPPYPSWGMMLQSGYPYLSAAPWLAITPGLIIFVTVLGFNFVGDGLEQYVRKIHKPR